MALVGNNAEGGTNGVTVTTGNSGGLSGTAFSNVVTGGGASLTFDNSQAAHGSLSYHCVTPTNTQAYVQLSPTPSVSLATRFYIRFNALPGAAAQFWMNNISNGGSWRNGGGSSNQFAISDNAGTLKTFTTTITTGVWYRLEMELTRGTTTSNGYMAGRVYLGDSTTPVEAGFSTNTANLDTVAAAGNFTANWFGITGLNPLAAFDVWIDDLNLADGTTTPIGPPIVAAPSGGGSWS